MKPRELTDAERSAAEAIDRELGSAGGDLNFTLGTDAEPPADPEAPFGRTLDGTPKKGPGGRPPSEAEEPREGPDPFIVGLTATLVDTGLVYTKKIGWSVPGEGLMPVQTWKAEVVKSGVAIIDKYFPDASDMGPEISFAALVVPWCVKNVLEMIERKKKSGDKPVDDGKPNGNDSRDERVRQNDATEKNARAPAARHPA